MTDEMTPVPIVRIPGAWPVGHLDDSGLYWWNEKTETMHNVPVELAMEVGGGAGFVWVLATAMALHKYNRQRRDAY